jgi:hypothetical protein
VTHYCDLWPSAAAFNSELHNAKDDEHQFFFFFILPSMNVDDEMLKYVMFVKYHH